MQNKQEHLNLWIDRLEKATSLCSWAMGGLLGVTVIGAVVGMANGMIDEYRESLQFFFVLGLIAAIAWVISATLKMSVKMAAEKIQPLPAAVPPAAHPNAVVIQSPALTQGPSLASSPVLEPPHGVFLSDAEPVESVFNVPPTPPQSDPLEEDMRRQEEFEAKEKIRREEDVKRGKNVAIRYKNEQKLRTCQSPVALLPKEQCYYYSGASYYNENTKTKDEGDLVITDQRVVFIGVSSNKVVPINSLLKAIKVGDNGFSLVSSKRPNPDTFHLDYPTEALAILCIAAARAGIRLPNF